MNYFDDIKIIAGRHLAGCCVHVRSYFPLFYTVEYLHAGRMYWRVDGGNRIILDRPAVFWHRPGVLYEYGPADAAGWDHYYLVLRGARARRLVADGFSILSRDGYVFAAQPAIIREMFMQLIAMAHQLTAATRAEAVIMLERILQLTAFVPASGVLGAYGRKIMELAERMRRQPFAVYSPDVLARDLHVCLGHFRRLFRRHAGRSFHNYLLHCRMRQAAVWLETEGLAVKAAADRAGCADQAQFSKLFKKQIGLSPKQYRQDVLMGAPGYAGRRAESCMREIRQNKGLHA